MLRLFKNGLYDQFKSLNSCRGEIEMPVASFFEHTRQRHEVHTWMNKGILPVKYAYVGSGAYAHQKLTATRGYQKVTGRGKDEFRALLHSMPSSEIPEQIAEVGLGTGVHTASFLQALRQAGHPAKRFLGFDFSEALLNIGSTHLRSKFPEGLDIRSQYWDAEAAPTDTIRTFTGAPQKTIVTFLGQTLGNVENPLQTLQNVRDSVAPGDQLLLSVALQSPTRTSADYLRPYQNPTFMEAIAEPLRMVGLRVEHGELTLTYEDNAVVGKFTLLKDQIIQHPSRPAASLSKGTIIRCFMSRRFKQKDIEEMLNKAGWRKTNYVHQNKRSIGVYLATACEPRTRQSGANP
jgi:uncharacterized SAM-dependent methyltransferase